jgi:diguanylate cyclase (GGDEF)-like protein/PAS domain S-box-containing protein
MRSLFLLSTALMQKLSYSKKLSLLGLISMIAISVVVYGFFVSLNKDVRTLQQELAGLTLVRPIARTVQLMQQHRGLSAGFLGGVQDMLEGQASKAEEVDDAISVVEENLPARLKTSTDWQIIRADWQRLKRDGLDWSVKENFTAQTLLIEKIQLFEVAVADEHTLTFDPAIDSHYLIDATINKLPHVLEHLGQIRAYGIASLAARQADDLQKMDFSAMMGELNSAVSSLTVNLGKTARYNPSMWNELRAASEAIEYSAQEITSLVKSDIFTGRFTTAPTDFYQMASAEIDTGYSQMYELLLPATRVLLQARIARAEKALYTSVGVALLLFMIVAYLAVGFYYATISSIESLTLGVRIFAGGNADKRIHLDTRDELKQVGSCFNEMADGFNAMLNVHREDEMRLRAIIETALDAIVQMDEEGIITGWNMRATATFGWSREEAIGQKLHQLIVPTQYRKAHVQGLKRFLASGRRHHLSTRVELTGLHRDGHEFPIELAVTSVKVADRHEFSGFISDISERKKAEDMIWKQANFDTLTKLPNRRMFLDRLKLETKKAHRAGLIMALLFIDMDNFKEVNDTLGHDMGDLLLVEAAQRISDCVRESDTVARLGGDEFTVILSELDDISNIDRITGNILQKLAQTFLLQQEKVYLSASIGITLYPEDATNVEELLKSADQAMYAAKDAGRNRFSYFTPSMQEMAQTRLQLARDLRIAVSAGQFTIHYQPILNLSTGRIEKAEALVRWQHPEQGLISPARFIPVAEETGLIVEIGDWVFREATRQLKHWMSLNSNLSLRISVNMSPVQFRNAAGSVIKTWFDYLQTLGLPEHSVILEITEGLLLDTSAAITDKLRAFHDAGIQISIDDFGTGYSSLSYLKKFEIDYLKIDQSFVRDLTTDPSDMALSEAIIIMAHKLDLEVVAEGVETEAQHRLLAGADCDYGQGYLFAKPLQAEEFEQALKDNLSKLDELNVSV